MTLPLKWLVPVIAIPAHDCGFLEAVNAAFGVLADVAYRLDHTCDTWQRDPLCKAATSEVKASTEKRPDWRKAVARNAL